ncbi:fibronectin type III domain-containing protein [bacterium]|nr:fibronectin type III domain-containing protein [bacterium]MBU1634321.1 fibronectin type III domain-containing protein [bacterium]MBU1874577.1 fibronectin type III domain-containing protein [bacterium]
MNYKILLIALIISGYFACEDLERKNPVDPNFVLETPSNLTLILIDDQSVCLNWDDNCKQEEGFVVECKIEGSAFAEIADLNANTETYTDTDLTYGKNYAYRVKAFADRNESNYSNELQATVKIPTPTNLTATAIDDQSLRLTWTDNCAYESGYRIERNDGSGFSNITELSADVTTYKDEGLTYGQSYSYRVKAYTDQNESNYSNVSNSIKMIILAPTNLIAEILDEHSVHLTWTDNCIFEAGFKVERKEESGEYSEIADMGANTTNYTDQELTQNINYTYRVFANSANNQSEYSNIAEVIRSVTDIDDNVYKVVKIGNQWWMAENLKVKRYRNGNLIPNVTDGMTWANLETGAYCNNFNIEYYGNVYGALYNGYAVNDSRNIAPEGWHVPSDEEWKELEMYLGMSQSEADTFGWRGTDEGGKLKETGTNHWNSPNTGATNVSGFTALAGGYRDGLSDWSLPGYRAYFWSSTGLESSGAYARCLIYNNSNISRSSGKGDGYSVRCVRN